jgi:phage head maturation protease
MAASTAITGYGAVFAVETALNSGVFTDLLETTSITAPNASVDEVDVTHMQSPGRREGVRARAWPTTAR